jgi:hypothetical protein
MTFLDSILSLSLSDREEAIYSAVTAQNVPLHMQDFYSLVTPELTLFVKPDYLIVDPESPLYVPLWPTTSQRVADHFNCMLPTTAIVDLIWKYADGKVAPRPMGPPYDATMSSTKRVAEHSVIARKMTSSFDGKLIAGHKKDVVITNRLPKDRVAIYGWHQLNGKPIQPLHLEHSNHYCDYSHGIRLISRHCIYDGADADLVDLLSSKFCPKSLSTEGQVNILKYLVV